MKFVVSKYSFICDLCVALPERRKRPFRRPFWSLFSNFRSRQRYLRSVIERNAMNMNPEASISSYLSASGARSRRTPDGRKLCFRRRSLQIEIAEAIEHRKFVRRFRHDRHLGIGSSSFLIVRALHVLKLCEALRRPPTQ